MVAQCEITHNEDLRELVSVQNAQDHSLAVVARKLHLIRKRLTEPRAPASGHNGDTEVANRPATHCLRDILEEVAAKVGVTDCGDVKITAYENAVRVVGLEPVRLTAGKYGSLDDLNGLLLTGGADVNPRRYGQEARAETQKPDDARDELEFSLLAEALALDLPVLAICRGMQLLNVHLHGTLQQHLPSVSIHQQRFPDDPPGKHRGVHAIDVFPGTLLASTIGPGRHMVNSRHHQAVCELGTGAIKSAVSEDSVTEAMEMPSKRFVLAVQWHPENRLEVSEDDRKLFEAFAGEVGGFRR
jgi:putative glutamine amidotransferase